MDDRLGSGTHHLPPYLVAGNRFGTAGLVLGMTGFLLSLMTFLQPFAWLAAVAGTLLAGIGFVKYCRQEATNPDAAIVGALSGCIGLVILLTKAAVVLQVPLTPY